MISKKELLKEMNISYGQLYRWKREGLIPDEWFNKQAVSTGQETFFKKDLIVPRIEKILELKDKYQLEELKSFFNPHLNSRMLTLREAILIDEIDPIILKMYSKKHEKFTIYELAVLTIFSQNKDVLDFELYKDYNFGEKITTDHYFYILNQQNHYILISGENIILDHQYQIYQKIKIEDVVSKIAASLKE